MAQSKRRNMRWVMVFGLIAALPFAVPPSAAQTAADATIAAVLPCGQLKGLVIPDSAITIARADAVPTSAPNTVLIRPPSPDAVSVAVPSHCRAEGEIDPRVGSDGKPYAIGFTINLPDRWNGRFLFQGGGGLNDSRSFQMTADTKAAPLMCRSCGIKNLRSTFPVNPSAR